MDDLTEDGFETPANLASLPPQVAERRTRQPATRALPRPVRKKRTFLALDSDSEDSADGKSPFKPPPSQFDDIKKRKQEKGISEPIVRTIERNMSSPLTNLPEHKLPRFRQSSYSNVSSFRRRYSRYLLTHVKDSGLWLSKRCKGPH